MASQNASHTRLGSLLQLYENRPSMTGTRNRLFQSFLVTIVLVILGAWEWVSGHLGESSHELTCL